MPQHRKKRRGKAAADFFGGVVSQFISDILDGPAKEPWPRQSQRIRIGATGGLVYAGLKGLIYEGFAGFMMIFIPPEPGTQVADSIAGFLSAATVAAVAGGAAAWITSQKSRPMQFLIGMMGLQLFLYLIPGLQTKETKRTGTVWLIEQTLPITPAYAQTEEKCVGDTAFSKGFKTFFGARERYDRYAVVVASGKTRTDAQSKIRTISAEDQTLKLRVGPRSCDNDFYPVFASDFLPQSEAKTVLEKVRKLKSAPDAYLSPGPKE